MVSLSDQYDPSVLCVLCLHICPLLQACLRALILLERLTTLNRSEPHHIVTNGEPDVLSLDTPLFPNPRRWKHTYTVTCGIRPSALIQRRCYRWKAVRAWTRGQFLATYGDDTFNIRESKDIAYDNEFGPCASRCPTVLVFRCWSTSSHHRAVQLIQERETLL
eukprot:m.1463584 g.1463584  ORF g.1463584 m.1463584 type:complete len:163 (-) comp25134_c0_seq74:4519-5007(-)